MKPIKPSIKKSKYLPPVIDMKADHTFTNVLDMYVWIYKEYWGGSMDNAKYLFQHTAYRIGDTFYHNGYKVDYPFLPTDFFSLECTEGLERIELDVFDMEEVGLLYVWVSNDDRILVHHLTDDEYYLQEQLIANHTFNVSWFLKNNKY